jgi:hypothetical protein
LIIELAQADPNLTNAYRSHLGFTEDLLNAPPSPWRDAWLERIRRGETIGSGFSEIGDAKLGTYSTQLTRDGGGWRPNGEKYYTTGSLYADWITLGAVDGDGVPVGALVPTKSEGVEILNDWDGFGQALTASGTARFTDVAISEDLIKPSALRFSYSGGFSSSCIWPRLPGSAARPHWKSPAMSRSASGSINAVTPRVFPKTRRCFRSWGGSEARPIAPALSC